MDSQSCKLSIVVPFLNEQDSIEPLYKQITDALVNKYAYEMVFVDDGSTDESITVLNQLQQYDNKIRIIRFSRNFGQTAALSAGFKYAEGEIVVAIDADLQNDPADIPKLVTKLLYEEFDVVSGWRKERSDKFISRILTSMAANWLIARITGVKLHDFGCTIKAYRRQVLEQMRLYGEMHRFIPALASWSRAKIIECVVNHRPRTNGVAKYRLTVH
ncbi:MAG: glycosyltransferase family 2 protein [Planctomycetota bacterium]|jgi:glycosyltransferase involved in cell wall biosynthesis